MSRSLHTGRLITVTMEGKATDNIYLDQQHYAQGLRQIAISKERQQQPNQTLTKNELSALRAGTGKVAWIKKTRPDLCVRVASLQQATKDPIVEHIAEHHQAVVAAVRDSGLGIRLVPCDWNDPRFRVYGIGDSAFMNTGDDKTES